MNGNAGDATSSLSPQELRWMLSQLRDTGMTTDDLAFGLEFELDELARFEQGNDDVWLDRLTPDYQNRLRARLTAMAVGATRRAEEESAHAERLLQVYELLEQAGVPDGMNIGEAIEAGYVTEEEVQAVLVIAR